MPSSLSIPPSPTPPPALESPLKPPRQPMLWAALAYSVGIIAGTYLAHPPALWIAAASAFLLAGLYFLHRRKSLAATLALGAFFLAGALHIQLRRSTNFLDTTLQPFTDGQPVELTAHVTREGRFRPGDPNEFRQTLDVQTEQIVTADGNTTCTNSGIRLGIYNPAGSQFSPQAP